MCELIVTRDERHDNIKNFHCLLQVLFRITYRASNRLKYRSGLGSGSTKFIFSGLPPVQVFRRLILRV